MRLIIHVGFAKCASTSLQTALYGDNTYYFPKHGLHDYEHIVIPIKLKGLDEWTAQWIKQEWVDKEYNLLIEEITASNKDVIVSSERLAGISNNLLEQFTRSCEGYDVEILLLHRPVDDYVKSVWRHSVFRLDLVESFDSFREHYKNFDLTRIVESHAEKFTVHALDISDEGFASKLNNILGMPLVLTRENISVPFECCEYLQKIHAYVGSSQFKEFFTPQKKREFASMFSSRDALDVDEFIVPIR